MPAFKCQREKSPRYVREKVPEPKPPTGAPCQYPSSIKSGNWGLRVPGFGSGTPIPRCQAIFGIASPAHREESAEKVMKRRTAHFAMRNFMQPPASGTDEFGRSAADWMTKSIL